MAIPILATGKTMLANHRQPVLAKARASSNCELREFPEIVQSKEEKNEEISNEYWCMSVADL
jgi:hypothetical protein